MAVSSGTPFTMSTTWTSFPKGRIATMVVVGFIPPRVIVYHVELLQVLDRWWSSGRGSRWDGVEWCGVPESARGGSCDVESGMGVEGSGAA